MMLSLLILEPQQPGNDIDVFLAPLIEDLYSDAELGPQQPRNDSDVFLAP